MKLTRLPGRREAAKRVDTLKQVQLLVTKFRDETIAVRKQRGYVETVFPDADVAGSGRQLQAVRARASALSRLLSAATQSPDGDIQKAVAELRRAVEGASGTVQREWAAQVEAVVSKYERLAQALERAGVQGSAELRDAIARVRAMSKPPASQHEARHAAEDIRSVGPTLARLGVEGGLGGAVGGFLTAVAEGRGSAKALLDTEVRAFLDRHDLWPVLAVSFR